MAKNKKLKDAYNHQAMNMLKISYPNISFFAMQRVFKSTNCHFPQAYGILAQINRLFPNEKDTKNTWQCLEVEMPSRIFLKASRRKEPFKLDNPILLAQIQDIPELNQKETAFPVLDVLEDHDDDIEDNGVDIVDRDEVELECGCCFGEYPQSKMSQCSAKCGHFVCNGCIYRYVSEQLDGKDSVVFECIVEESCKGKYMESLLDRVLSPRLKKRVGSRVVQKEATKAGFITWTCSKCNDIGVHERLFSNVECFTCKSFYCVNCNEPVHKDRTCEDVQAEKARMQDPLMRAQKAMTMAVARECPSCKTPFVKFDGCNKITCSCGVMSCYMCRNKVQDYNHFCRHTLRPCPCGKPCKLWTNTQEMESHDEILRRQAGEKVLREEGFSEDRIRSYILSLDGTKEAIGFRQSDPLRPQDQENAAAVEQEIRVPVVAGLQIQIVAPLHPVGMPAQQVHIVRLDNIEEQGQVVEHQQQPFDIPGAPAREPANNQYCFIQ